MKHKLITGTAMAAMILFGGCDSIDKVETHVQKIEDQLKNMEAHLALMEKRAEKNEGKKGIPCDNTSALETLKSLMDKNSDAEYVVDTKNIVIWEYNPVGRYQCRAKVKKVGDKNPLGKEINIFMSTLYGLKEGGWIHYQTYITTADESNFYVTLQVINNDK